MKKLQVPKTYFIHELGSQENPEKKTAWLVCHGYGQLPEYFSRKFQALDLEKNFLVFPEAGNHYYLKGFTGRVAANWMTKHHRLEAIQDVNNYLTAVYESYALQGFKKVVLFGFSQGVNSIMRWMVDCNIHCDALVVWGARLTDDYLEKFVASNPQYPLHLVLGRQDELIPHELVADYLEAYRKMGLSLQYTAYEGGHDIYPDPLLEIANSM